MLVPLNIHPEVSSPQGSQAGCCGASRAVHYLLLMELPACPCGQCEQGPTWSRAQMQSLGIQPRRPNRCRRRKRSPGAKSRMFIFTDTARLSGKLHYHCGPPHGCPGSPRAERSHLPGAKLAHARRTPRRAAPALPPDPHLKNRQPQDQRSSRKRLMARKRMAMATGSLKSRRTKMEWMR